MRPENLRALWIAALSASALLAPAALAAPVSHTLTLSNVDWTSAGVGGVSNSGAGTISLQGVGGNVSRAFLYWHGIDSSGVDAVYDNATVTINGNAVTGGSLGDSSTNCWGNGASTAYRADVTRFVAGNGDYGIADLSLGSHSGNGASLVVIYDDGNPANDRDLAFFEGNDSSNPNGFPGEDTGWHSVLQPIGYDGGAVSAQLHVADGQSFADGSTGFSTADGNVDFPDSSVLVDGVSVPDEGGSRGGNGSLWDIHDFEITDAFGDARGAVSLSFDAQDQFNDCLGLVVLLVDLPAGSAPPAPGQREPRGWAEGIDLGSSPEGEGEILLAYLATQDGALFIDDVSTSTPREVASLPAPEVCSEPRYEDIVVEDDIAYIAGAGCGLVVVDATTPDEPTLVGVFSETTSFVKDAEPLQISETKTRIYIADYFNGLVVVDLENGVFSPVRVIGAAQGLTGHAIALDIDERDPSSPFVHVASTDGLFIVQPADTADPVVVGSVITNGGLSFPDDLFPSGNLISVPQDVVVEEIVVDDEIRALAFVPAWVGGLIVVDVTDPTNPFEHSRIAEEEPPVGTSRGVFYKVTCTEDGSRIVATEGTCGAALFDLGADGILVQDGANIEINEGVCEDLSDSAYAWSITERDGRIAAGWGILGTETVPRSGDYELFDALDNEAGVLGESPADEDGDGIPYADDNCGLLANTLQADVDADGYGDACDADYDNDGIVGNSDFTRLRNAMGSSVGDPGYDPVLDHDGSGTIGNPDFAVLRNSFGRAPGPSALRCSGGGCDKTSRLLQ